ncbi:MAG TPA: FeoA family protein [Syntrophobacteraceae bacterium]|nr:FeoA family protein [Syntrophobacteraceae bacterium]
MWKLWDQGKCCACSGKSGNDSSALPLSNTSAGQRCRVAGIEGGRHLCARLAAMGIYPGVEVEVVCAGCNCPCLVRVHGCTLSLGCGLSNKILVTSALR